MTVSRCGAARLREGFAAISYDRWFVLWCDSLHGRADACEELHQFLVP